MACGEFSLIARYFDRVTSSRRDVEAGIGDDCALLSVPEKQLLAISTDTLVSGNHFLPDIDPRDLGYKALAVNLSDLAAMGADPAWLTLAITLPEVDEAWLEAFSDSLFEQLDYYDMQLIGGDTTRGPLSLTLGIHGMIPAGRALKRSGAKAGDWIYVTGTPGDSAAGLAILQQRLQVANAQHADYLLKRHLRPTPRVLHGQALRDLANSAIDLSDGLISDLGQYPEGQRLRGSYRSRFAAVFRSVARACRTRAGPEMGDVRRRRL
ncbi:Thiamine-monophosphate kinase [Cedecea neteri]|uniref:Thiamine-monophosphate kinase n=1 Tax=Cedecea neteri TaxID=158822 RepID=A0A2X2T4R2_9ENTR|nr:Thiamine-monophosphate kinase [Cedecea neteri]